MIPKATENLVRLHNDFLSQLGNLIFYTKPCIFQEYLSPQSWFAAEPDGYRYRMNDIWYMYVYGLFSSSNLADIKCKNIALHFSENVFHLAHGVQLSDSLVNVLATVDDKAE